MSVAGTLDRRAAPTPEPWLDRVPREIRTDRLLLREWRADDFEPYAAFFADEASARHVGGRCDRPDAWRRFATGIGHWAIRGYGMYALETPSDRSFVGFAGVWRPEGWPELEVGWCLMPAARGSGYATEAAAACLATGFGTFGLGRLVSYIDPENLASRRVAERLGAVREGTIALAGGTADVFLHRPRGAGAGRPARERGRAT